jgi:hypothetical protein
LQHTFLERRMSVFARNCTGDGGLLSASICFQMQMARRHTKLHDCMKQQIMDLFGHTLKAVQNFRWWQECRIIGLTSPEVHVCSF